MLDHTGITHLVAGYGAFVGVVVGAVVFVMAFWDVWKWVESEEPALRGRAIVTGGLVTMVGVMIGILLFIAGFGTPLVMVVLGWVSWWLWRRT
jgi:hypothetical protein